MQSKRCWLLRWSKFRSLLILLLLFFLGMMLSLLEKKVKIVATKKLGASKMLRWRSASKQPVVKNVEQYNERKIADENKIARPQDSNRKSKDYHSMNTKSITSSSERKTKSLEKHLKENTTFSDLKSKKMREVTEKLKEKESFLQCSHSHLNSSKIMLPASYARMTDKQVAYPHCGGESQLQPWFYPAMAGFDMIILVKTAPKNIKLRNLVRNTWGSIRSILEMKFATIFLLGQPNTSQENDLLKEEHAIFGDMLQCQFIDKYENLPVKVLSSMRWLLQNHVTATYYTVTDDDVLLDLVNINAYFKAVKQVDVIYCGFVYEANAIPRRDNRSKWFVSEETYSLSHYPTFCHGGLWTIGRNLMNKLYCMAEMTNRQDFHLEDVYVTGILREKLGQGDANIMAVVSRPNRKFNLMYYPWTDDYEKAAMKLSIRWRKMNATLPWRRKNLVDHQPLMTTHERKVDLHMIDVFIKKWKEVLRNQLL